MTSNYTHRPISTLRACLVEDMMVLPSHVGAFAALRMRPASCVAMTALSASVYLDGA
jgi:hypothetical protein